MSLDITPAEADLPSTADESTPTLPRHTLWVMAAACGVSAANIYYNNPLLGDFAKYFHATASQAGLVATAAQVGYGIGLFFFVPLGDLYERRRVVLLLTFACAALLVLTALAPTLWLLIAAQLLVGITAMSAQLLIPLAIDLTPPSQRGKTVGTMMGGLLCGILLARTVGGFLGEHFGWQITYATAAAVMVLLGLLLAAELPHKRPSVAMSYPRLMHSMLHLLRTQPPLWVAGAVSGLSFGVFNLFWTVLSFLMAERFGRGAGEAGLFGVLGMIGALGAPFAGRLSDKRGSAFTVTLSLVITAASFLLMGAWVTIPSLIIGVLFMDLGVQSIQVAAQAEVISLVPEARSRMNTLYMVARFTGGAAGSWIGATAWTMGRWNAVCAVAIGMTTIAAVIHLFGARQTNRAFSLSR